MNPTTSKLAQVAKGSQTCTACGRTKDLSAFGVHPRWGTPMKKCESCITDIRRQAGARKSANAAKARAKAAVIEAKQAGSVPLLLAKLEGYAIGQQNKELTALIHELRKAVNA